MPVEVDIVVRLGILLTTVDKVFQFSRLFSKYDRARKAMETESSKEKIGSIYSLEECVIIGCQA